jgi:D-3-phosphoglycerate dehydrogenase
VKVLVVSRTFANRLAKLLPDDIEIISPKKGTDEELIRLAGDVDIIVSTRLSVDVAKAAKKLKFLQKTGAGVDAMPFDVLGKDVFIANTSGANPTPLAEGAVALVLSLAKKVVQRNRDFLKGRAGGRGTLLKGKKVAILGLGSIGLEVARMLQAFDMKILGLKRHPSKDLLENLNLEFIGGPDELHYVLKESDFVVVTLPLTPETKGLIGEEELRQMKPTAYIVNVARANIIQEEPLYRALKQGRIAGAAIDVWWVPHWWDPVWNPENKPPSNFPFWELPNFIATPHMIGFTDSGWDVALKIIAENIMRVASGGSPINQVDKKLRY